MGVFDATFQGVAEAMIVLFGGNGTIRRLTATGPAHDPDLAATDYACQLVVLDYEKREIDGTLVRQGDRKVYVSTEGLTISPETADQLVIGGEAWAIVSVKPLSPAGTVLFWEIQARA